MMPVNLNNLTKNIEDLNGFAGRSFKQANEFRITALTLFNELNLFKQTAFATTTNAAFACELYMKSLIAVLHNKKLDGHILDELFSKIEDDTVKERIMHAVQRTDFDSVLSNVGDAFRKVRYANEYAGMTIEVEFLFRLMNALHNECQKALGIENSNSTHNGE